MNKLLKILEECNKNEISSENAMFHIEQLFKKYKDMDWISVNDRFPENKSHGFSEMVLTSTELGTMGVSRYDHDNNYWNMIMSARHITHWMPLPEPPKQ